MISVHAPGRWLAVLALAGLCQVALAESCMVSPTDKEVVSGRFGKFRGGGASNHGSANQTAHMHDGLDFSTNGASLPLYATTAGTIKHIGLLGSAGNAILIARDNGDIVAYYHMSGFASGLQNGSKVTAGQQLGLSGNTPSTAMAKHLHLTYGTPLKDDARAKSFSEKAHLSPFDPAKLGTPLTRKNGIGWRTDPSPYFCKTYSIQDGHPEHYGILGKDTKAQYQILYGNVPDGGTPPDTSLAEAQVVAANADTVLAQAEGKTPETFLSDADGYGSLPSAPIGGYDTMSTSEMMATEATRRFADAEWNTNVTSVSSRALWVDYNRAVGVGNYLSEAIYRKKERVEALLAVYTSQKMAAVKAQTARDHEIAQTQSIKQAIQ